MQVPDNSDLALGSQFVLFFGVPATGAVRLQFVYIGFQKVLIIFLYGHFDPIVPATALRHKASASKWHG
jgi:hypothetical protein